MTSRAGTPLPHEFAQAVSGSFDNSRLPIKYIIIHTMAGTLDGTTKWFQNGNRAKLNSAHYGIGFSGRIVQYVDESKTAYHAGNYSINQCSIGIEHEDLNQPQLTRPDALYEASAKLVADCCKFYGIPITREFIKKHNEVSKSPTACPAALDIERIIKMANEVVNSEPTHTYEMPESQFINLVTGSRNFDDLLTVFNGLVPDDQKLQANNPKAGERVADYLKYYQTAYFELTKHAEITAQSEPIQTPQAEAPAPQAIETIPAVSHTYEAPNGVQISKATYDQTKSWFIRDVVGVFRHFADWLGGN